MKNTFGKDESLRIYNKEGVMIYQYLKCLNNYSWVSTYDKNGNELTFEDLNNYSYIRTFDENGNTLTFKDSNNYSFVSTYDENSNELTFEDSDGFIRGFDKQIKSMVIMSIIDNCTMELDNTGQESYSLDGKQFEKVVDTLVRNINEIQLKN